MWLGEWCAAAAGQKEIGLKRDAPQSKTALLNGWEF